MGRLVREVLELTPPESRTAPSKLSQIIAGLSRGCSRRRRELDPAAEPSRLPAELTAIPYFRWANRGANAMRVWIPTA